MGQVKGASPVQGKIYTMQKDLEVLRGNYHTR